MSRNWFGAAFARADVGQIVVERDQTGQPHKGKVFAAVHAHLDDMPYYAGGLCAKLINEGYTGYLIRTSNDEKCGGQSTAQNILSNEQEHAKVAKALGFRDVRVRHYGDTAKHIAVADWIEEMAGARLVDHSELLAHHTTEAIALGAAAGEHGDAELNQRAARYLVLAGDRAIQLDVDRGVARYSEALELLPAGSEEHGLTLMRRAEAAQMQGRFEEASE